MSRLELDPTGRIVSPDGTFTITYDSPFPTVNGSWGRFSEPADGMVVHTEVGYEHSVLQEFDNPNAQASAFCSISGGWSPGISDGQIHQYGPIGKGWMAWTQANGNSKWRGIEHEDGGDPNRPLTTLQLCSSAALLELFSRVDGFPIQATDDPINGRGLIFHVDGGAAWGGHDCPGAVRQAQRPTILYLAALCRGSVTAPTHQGAHRMFDRDPVTGIVVGTDASGDFFGSGIPGLGVVTLPMHPEWGAGTPTNPCVGFMFEKDADGTWGYTYFTAPASGHGSWGPYNRYHIRRNGTF